MNYKTVWGAAGIAVAGAMALSVSAQAADLGGRHDSYKDEPVYAAPASTWSGIYFGGHLGAAWTSGNVDTNLYEPGYTPASTHTDLGDTSFIGGVHGGVNWQAGAFVYGVEGDVSFANNIDYLASIRGRLGVAAGNWLFYGTGGVAFIGANGPKGTVSTTAYNDRGYSSTQHASYDFSDNQTGYVVGGGAEVKLNPNWSIGVEGLYYGFDGVSDQRSYSTVYRDRQVRSYDFSGNAGADIGVVRGRLSYHFNRGYEPLK